jgi:hypothetical protein
MDADEPGQSLSILDVVNMGNQKRPTDAALIPELKGRISDAQLDGIIDESQTNFFAQFDSVPTSGIKVDLTNDEGLGYVGSVTVGG